MTLIHSSDENISIQTMRATRALDAGLDSFAELDSAITPIDSLSIYYAGILENRLLYVYLERLEEKPSLPKWLNYWLAKRSVKKELKDADFPKEHLKLPKRNALTEKTYAYAVIIEELRAKYDLTSDDDMEVISEAEESHSEELLDTEGIAANVDSAEEDLIEEEATNEALNIEKIDTESADLRFSEEQLAQLARLLEENAYLKSQLTNAQQKIEELEQHTEEETHVEAEESETAEELASTDVAEDSVDIEETVDVIEEVSETEESESESATPPDVEKETEEEASIVAPVRPGRASMPSWDDIVSDVISDEHLVEQSEEQDTDITEPDSDAGETVDRDEETAPLVENSLTTEEVVEEDEDTLALAGLVEPPEEGFLYEDAVVDMPDEDPFLADEPGEEGADFEDSRRQIVVEKLVVQQQVTEQNYTAGPQAGAPATPVAPPEGYPSGPVAPPNYQLPVEEESEPQQPTRPQRPALPVFKPSAEPAPAAEEVPTRPAEPVENAVKEFKPAPAPTPSEEASDPVSAAPTSAPGTEAPESVTTAPVENDQPSEIEGTENTSSAVKEYQPSPTPAPAAQSDTEGPREKQTVHADMDVTADSVNITTKSGDPLADFDPSKYLNLANAFNTPSEPETEEIEEDTATDNSGASDNSSGGFFLEEPEEPLSDTAKVNAMLKELKQLRSSGKGGLI
jgi:hypothetical protein